VDIRFTSSLTPEDENAIAPALLTALSTFLDLLPIAYSVRIHTSDARIYEHVGMTRPEIAPKSPVQPPRATKVSFTDPLSTNPSDP
jgi:hypothetical protein